MPANVGSQTVTIKYHSPVDSSVVNKRFKDIRPVGIYSGGYLTITGADTVSLSPLVCEITDGTHQVRVETASSVTVTLTEGVSDYVVLRWTYTGSESDYMEILAVGTPSTYDLVVGKGIWSGGSLSSIDYGERDDAETLPLFLKVEPTETPSSSVRIRAGRSHTGSGYQNIANQIIDLSGYSSGDEIYIYITDTGGIAHSKTQSDYAGKALLAKVTYPADGTIEAGDIEDARCFIDSPTIPDPDKIWNHCLDEGFNYCLCCKFDVCYKDDRYLISRTV